MHDVQLAKAQSSRPTTRRTRTPTRKRRKPTSSAAVTTPAKKTKKTPSLSQLLTPKNMQETMKTVGNLRGMVKNWLGYLQQADRVLDTVFVTTTSLKESGVLDKLVKQRGKNLSTDDFTSILGALMSSPLGANLFKGGGDEEEEPTATPAQTTNPQPANPQAIQRPNQQNGLPPMG
ncbi:hypothetical protein [Alicyclobacillus fodiniaquatilis]|uniref:Uncharacterized protein n=1 Tax=Alicyclobacillus fodiniaquatilis TaxID=1661150 RepID=A0ABW4JHN8_9BACL